LNKRFSPKKRLHHQLRSEERIHPAKSGKGAGVRLREVIPLSQILLITTRPAWTKASEFIRIRKGRNWASLMRFDNTKDENLVVFYESIRQQVVADIRAGGRYRLIGDSVKQYAEKLREEMEGRRLKFTPIDWLP